MKVYEVNSDGSIGAFLFDTENSPKGHGYSAQPIAQWGDKVLNLAVYEKTGATLIYDSDEHYLVISRIGSYSAAYACRTEEHCNALIGRRLPAIREHLAISSMKG